jgi:hypothetical protein
VAEAGQATVALNEKNSESGRKPLNYGIGVQGDVMYGNIGSRTRLDFTVIGPAVDMASRLETLTKQLGRTALLPARSPTSLKAISISNASANSGGLEQNQPRPSFDCPEGGPTFLHLQRSNAPLGRDRNPCDPLFAGSQEARALQRPLPGGAQGIVATGSSTIREGIDA